MDATQLQLKTRDIESLVRRVNALHFRWRGYTLEYDPPETREAQAWRDQAIASLHRLVKPSVRPYAIPTLLKVIERMFFEWGLCLEVLEDTARALERKEGGRRLRTENERLAGEVQALRAQVGTMEQQLATTQAEVAAWRERALAAAPASVTIPAQTVTVRSKLDKEILRLIAVTGLARSWHVISRITAMGLTEHDNGVRNALKRLKDTELLADFVWNGKPQQWTPRAGGGRQLLRLTERGRTWAEMAFKVTAVPCELDVPVQKHKSVAHAVAILEARDHLRAVGYVVNDAPDPLLVRDDERWGQRTEPDLVAMENGVFWPVEVQLEIDRRNDEKWAKSLSLVPRMCLITVNMQMCEKQAEILRQAVRWSRLPQGEIRLASLEAMDAGIWKWLVIHS